MMQAHEMPRQPMEPPLLLVGTYLRERRTQSPHTRKTLEALVELIRKNYIEARGMAPTAVKPGSTVTGMILTELNSRLNQEVPTKLAQPQETYDFIVGLVTKALEMGSKTSSVQQVDREKPKRETRFFAA